MGLEAYWKKLGTKAKKKRTLSGLNPSRMLTGFSAEQLEGSGIKGDAEDASAKQATRIVSREDLGSKPSCQT